MRTRIARNILCIGTDPVNLNLRCAFLKKQGWETVSCGSGHEGIFRFAKGDIGLVILDLGGEGVEAALIASEFKRQGPSLPIIMLVSDKDALVPGATTQADAVVLKSEEEVVLPDCVRRLLQPA